MGCIQMLAVTNKQKEISKLDELFPDNPATSAHAKAADVLLSHMIMGFEESLDLGMPPMDALSQILHWVSAEMTRIGIANQCSTPYSSQADRSL